MRAHSPAFTAGNPRGGGWSNLRVRNNAPIVALTHCVCHLTAARKHSIPRSIRCLVRPLCPAEPMRSGPLIAVTAACEIMRCFFEFVFIDFEHYICLHLPLAITTQNVANLAPG